MKKLAELGHNENQSFRTEQLLQIKHRDAPLFSEIKRQLKKQTVKEKSAPKNGKNCYPGLKSDRNFLSEKDKNSGRIATLKEQNVTLSAGLIYMN